MKRLFRWKGILIVAMTLEDAWAEVVQIAMDHGYGGNVIAWERENRGFEDEDFDQVSTREYLAAVDPDELVHLGYDEFPSGLGLFLEHGSPIASSSVLGITVTMAARNWADILPTGWVHIPDEG